MLTLKGVKSDTNIIVSLLLPRFNPILDTVSTNLKCRDVIDECFLTDDDISWSWLSPFKTLMLADQQTGRWLDTNSEVFPNEEKSTDVLNKDIQDDKIVLRLFYYD